MAIDRGAALTGANGPSVGAVVVNYNGGERVLRVLAALDRQRYPLDEVIVVDNASADGSRERIQEEYPAVRVLGLRENLGLPIARNSGLRELNTTLVLLLDHDVYVDEDCVDRLVKAYMEFRPTVVCPRIRLLPERDIVQADGAALHFLGTLMLRNANLRVDCAPAIAGPVDACIGACMLVNRAQVMEAGGFDELFFFYFEDLEFSMRLRAIGHRIWCEPAAQVFHERGAGTPNLSFRGQEPYPPRRAYLTMRNRLISMLIHYRLRTLLMLSPVLALYELASFVAACWKGWPAEWLRAWYWQFDNLATIVSRRRRMQRLRSIGDRELLVGGIPPLAPAFLRSSAEKRLLAWFSLLVNRYWNLARGSIG